MRKDAKNATHAAIRSAVNMIKQNRLLKSRLCFVSVDKPLS